MPQFSEQTKIHRNHLNEQIILKSLKWLKIHWKQ